MKKFLLLSAIIFFAGIKLKAADDSDSLGLPGDNLDLAGVLDLFKASSSLDDFEKKLNDPSTDVNNLDLNKDGNVDYIRVVDEVSGDAHDIVLQDPVSEKESQDVAVIELEKNGDASAQLQIAGDEELYGENYFVEPKDDQSTTTDGKWQQGFKPVVVFVNVWMWPSVRFLYAPAYVVYVSPWRWNYYPAYWHPWHPVLWRVHYEHAWRYHEHCQWVHECRMTNANSYYGPHRCASAQIHREYAEDHQRHQAMETGRSSQGERASNNHGANGQKVNPPAEHPSAQSTGKSANTKSTGGKKQGMKNGGGNKGGGGNGGNRGGGNRGGGGHAGNRGGGGHGGGGGKHR